MTINEYLQKHFREIKQKIIAVTRNHKDTDDLISDCILSLLEKGSDYTQQLLQDNKVQHYLVKMAYIQYNSSTSPFHLNYRNTKTKQLDDNIEIEDNIETKVDNDKLAKDIKIYIGNLPFYQKELANKHLLEGKSQREMSRMYNINRIHISREMRTVKSNIQLKFNKNDYRSK